MEEIKANPRKVELAALRAAAEPVALWNGEPRRSSEDHDSVHDEP